MSGTTRWRIEMIKQDMRHLVRALNRYKYPPQHLLNELEMLREQLLEYKDILKQEQKDAE